MHLYIATRGQKDRVDNMINDLQAIYYPYKGGPHSKPGEDMVQLGVRPWQFWEIVFPKEHLNEILATIGGNKFNVKDRRPLAKCFAFLVKLKKFMGLKSVPEIPANTPRRLIRREYVDVKHIGIKEDEYDGSTELI